MRTASLDLHTDGIKGLVLSFISLDEWMSIYIYPVNYSDSDLELCMIEVPPYLKSNK